MNINTKLNYIKLAVYILFLLKVLNYHKLFLNFRIKIMHSNTKRILSQCNHKISIKICF